MFKVVILTVIFGIISSAFCWFLVPMAYWDSEDSLTTYFALGFGDTTKYGAAEVRYAPSSEALRAELTIRLPFAKGTEFHSKYIDATTNDPRKYSIFIPGEDTLSDTTLTDITEKVREYSIRLEQDWQAGIETKWGLFATYSSGKYFSDYTLSDYGGWSEKPETTEATYVGGGISFGYDSRNGNLDPDKGYVFHIEAGADYLLQDTLDADYVDAATHTSKVVGFAYVEQRTYTPASALPVQIPLLTVQAPTILATKMAIGYRTSDVAQLIGYRSGDFQLFRGLPHRNLSGNKFYLLSLDFRISPVKRMYTPMTVLHLIAPGIISDSRADIEFTPFFDFGKIYGANPEKTFFSTGGGIALKFSKTLITRFDFQYCPTFDNFTTYFAIRHPF